MSCVWRGWLGDGWSQPSEYRCMHTNSIQKPWTQVLSSTSKPNLSEKLTKFTRSVMAMHDWFWKWWFQNLISDFAVERMLEYEIGIAVWIGATFWTWGLINVFFLKHSTLCTAVFHSVLACICLCLYLFVEVAGKIRLCESFDGNSRLSQIGQSTHDFKIQSGPPPNYLPGRLSLCAVWIRTLSNDVLL